MSLKCTGVMIASLSDNIISNIISIFDYCAQFFWDKSSPRDTIILSVCPAGIAFGVEIGCVHENTFGAGFCEQQKIKS